MFPAKVDDDLVNALHACSLPDDNFKTVKGTTLCADDFYEGMLCTCSYNTHTYTHARAHARTRTHTHRDIYVYICEYLLKGTQHSSREMKTDALHFYSHFALIVPD